MNQTLAFAEKSMHLIVLSTDVGKMLGSSIQTRKVNLLVTSELLSDRGKAQNGGKLKSPNAALYTLQD